MTRTAPFALPSPTMKALAPLLLAATLLASHAAPTVESVTRDMKRVADWQLANPSKHPITDWTQAPFFLGLFNLHQVSGEAKYLGAVEEFGRRAGFGPGRRVVHPDDHAVLQAWLELHRTDRDLDKLRPSIERFDALMEKLRGKPAASETGGTFTFSWCDTLFMSPPVWTHLSKLTGDPRYLEWSDREWWTCTDLLYDPQHCLFYRDRRFFDRRSDAGSKVFWSRGNGWVIGGLVHVLDHLPADHPSRGKYLGLYHDMMRALVELQNADGLWRTSLLDAQGDDAEASGTAFFVYGLAWGLNRGLLPEDPFRPALEKGWEALAGCIQADGMPGFIQRIGDRPGNAGPRSTEVYGTGAILLAGAEIVRGLDPTKRRPGLADFEGVELPARFLRSEPRVAVRFVPDRSDDFAFENDLVAFRAYGPALRPGSEDGGFDAWPKRVPYPVMDKWYVEDRTKVTEYQTSESGKPPEWAAKSYHEDQGEGYDVYKVGDSRGCGGISLWIDGQPAKLETFVAYRLLEETPERAAFQLDHAIALPDGRIARERKQVTLVLGSRLIQCDSKFTIDGEPGEFEVAIGLKHQTGDATFSASPETGRFALWETIDGLGLGTGIVLDPQRVVKTAEHGEGEARQSLVVARTDAAGHVRWFTGFGWEGQGGIRTEAQWLDHLREFEAKPFTDPEFEVHQLDPPAN